MESLAKVRTILERDGCLCDREWTSLGKCQSHLRIEIQEDLKPSLILYYHIENKISVVVTTTLYVAHFSAQKSILQIGTLFAEHHCFAMPQNFS